MESRDLPPAAQLPHRTNTDLNLGVLRRYLPSITAIVSIAANAVVYNFSPTSQSWDKTSVEGTLFVCEQEPRVIAGLTILRACVFVLNRRGLNNLVVELNKASVCEASDELIMFNVENASGVATEEDGGDTQVIGIWIHADQDDTRQVNMAVIQEAWRRVRLIDREDTAAGMSNEALAEQAELNSSRDKVTGRRLSISDLFGQKKGNVT